MTAFNLPYISAEVYGEVHHVPKNSQHRPASQCILNGRYYEPMTHQWVKQRLDQKPGSMIHAGTYFGDMIPSFSQSVGDYTLYAFEPVLENYVFAKLTVEANKLDNVFLQNSALSDKFEVLKIKTQDGNVPRGGGSIITPTGNETITAITIDSLGIQDLSLIQLDVEEHEFQCLTGALGTIIRCRPMIMVEDFQRKTTPLLVSLGYQNTHGNHDVQCWNYLS